MKYALTTVLLISIVGIAHAEENAADQPHHLISIGTDGFGWSGTGTTFEFDDDKTTRDDQTVSNGSFNLNYNYIFNSRFMLGGEVAIEYSKSEIEFDSGREITEEERTSTLALSLGYNFNKDIYNSFWIKGFLGGGRVDTEVEDDINANDSDSDSSLAFVTLEFGKRFTLGKMKNFTYSPSIALTSASFGDDAEDAGLESSTTAQLNILKFDVLF